MTGLPVELACRLALCPPERRWLIEGLWAEQAVGIVGGEPKCCKSFLALDMAVAVASGTPCLRRFSVAHSGRVLLYAAEDALHVVRSRLDGIARAAALALAALDIHVITAPSLRLDLTDDQLRLADTVASLQPKLLVLDPLVRLHRIDENAAAEVAPLLAYLRDLQRRFHVAVVLVHHARKGARHLRAGQALRGSSELHAWGDSNLYLRRTDEQLLLTIEHRAAPSKAGLVLALRGDEDHLALAILDSTPAPPSSAAPEPSPTDKIERLLAQAGAPVRLAALRAACRLRATTVTAALAELRGAGRVRKTPAGYELAIE